MLLDISGALSNPGRIYPVDASVEVGPEIVLDDPVSFFDVRLVGELHGSGQSVSIRGEVTATIASRCANCLKDISFPVSAEVDEIFVRQEDAEGEDQYLLSGSRLNPHDMIREALLLALPMRYLCSEDCRGLCPGCGANLNDTLCTCQEGGARRNPFAALSELFKDDEEV